MATLDCNPKRYFWIQDERTFQEMKTVMSECPEGHVHPRLVQQGKQQEVLNRVYKFRDFSFLRKTLFDFLNTHDVIEYFGVDLDTVSDDTLTEIVQIKHKYMLFGKKCAAEIEKAHLLHTKVYLSAELFKMSYLFKPMTYNGDYFVPLNYKAMLLALLRLMQKSYLFALVLFCELCPDFLGPPCYPKFLVIDDAKVDNNTFDCSGQLSKLSCYHEGVFNDPFYTTFYEKHKTSIHFVLNMNVSKKRPRAPTATSCTRSVATVSFEASF